MKALAGILDRGKQGAIPKGLADLKRLNYDMNGFRPIYRFGVASD